MNVREEKIKVVFLTDCLADLAGGAERQIFELAKRLNKEKFSITIASLESVGKASPELIRSISCRLETFPVKRIYGFSGLLEGFRFVRFLKKMRIEILMTYHFSSDIWGTVMAKMAGVPVIISNRRDMGFWRKKRHILAYKIINRYVTRIIVNAKAIKTLILREECLDGRKVTVVHNGIDLLESDVKFSVTEFRNELGIKKNDTLIAHVANIKPVKGHEYLLKAFADIAARHSNVKLILIGEDKLDGKMQDFAEQLGIKGNVLFLGRREDARFLLRAADICVLPSLSEGMSNAIMEYMEAGKPVIATNVGGNPELIEDGVNGFLVEKGDIEGLKYALLALLEDKEKSAAMGKKGQERILGEFSTEKMLKDYENIFGSFELDTRRILHLISSSGYFGAESILMTLARNIHDGEYISIVGAFKDYRDNSEIKVIELARESGIQTYMLKCCGRMDIFAIFRLRRYLKQNRVDILHTHNYKSDIIGALAARMAGVPIVATAHGFTDMTSSVSFYEKLDRLFLRMLFRRVVVVTEKMLPGLSQKVKRVIPNGIDAGQFTRNEEKRKLFRKEHNINEGDVLIGTIGRLSREKNQKMLLEALYPMMRDNELVKAVIVGGGPKEDELKQFGESRHLSDRILFTGIMTDTVSVYSSLDIFVLTSLTEGVPLTVLEAMASKLPVVATRVGGIPQIIEDGRTGLLIDAQDTEALRAKIGQLIQDPAKRRQLGDAAQAFVIANYSLQRMCNAYREVYEEVLLAKK
ncbi:MAG: glycosyltransferase [Candidatus Omnitrophica bacterium]|nr:glycosyltransferase [Candidatus Omnitrophota bacterium]